MIVSNAFIHPKPLPLVAQNQTLKTDHSEQRVYDGSPPNEPYFLCYTHREQPGLKHAATLRFGVSYR